MQRQIHGRDSRLQAAGELDADNGRDQRRDGLPQRGRLGFDAADTPAEHADAICRRRMGIGADKRIEVRCDLAFFLCSHNNAGKALDVQLMADARSRRHDAHIVEAFLRPPQKRIALAVALEFERHVIGKRRGATGLVGDNGMVDHQIAGHLRVHARRIATKRLHRLAHHGEVNENRYAGEVLEQNAGRRELDLIALPARAARRDETRGQLARPIFVWSQSQDVLQQHLQRIRQLFGTFHLVDGIVRILFAANFEQFPHVQPHSYRQT